MAELFAEDIRAYVEEGDPGSLPWQVQLRLLHERLLTNAEGQIETWAHNQQDTITREHALFQRADDGIISFDDALRGLREHNDDRDWDVAWDAHAQTPAYQEELRHNAVVDAAIDRVTSPEYLGEQAEQRFYAEQDPGSEWYREDLYHGEMGPDLAQVYQPSGEEVDPHLEIWPPEYAPAYVRPLLEPDYSTQHFGMEAEDDPRADLVESALDVDAADPQMGERWEAVLEALGQRLDAFALKDEEGWQAALTNEDAHDIALGQDQRDAVKEVPHRQRMSY